MDKEQSVLARLRKVLLRLATTQARLVEHLDDDRSRTSWRSKAKNFLARFFVGLALFLLHIPFYVFWGPTRTFEALTPRADNGTYLNSYRNALRQHTLSAATVTTVVFLVAVKIVATIVLTVVVLPSRPAEAVSSSVSLNPTWDRSSYMNNQVTPSPDCSLATLYNCESATATTLKAGLTLVDVGCDVGAEDKFTYRGAMQFDLSSIPDNATITDADLAVNVSTTTSATITILRTNVDNIQASGCTGSSGTGMYSRMGSGTTYVSATDWTSTGAKTYDLGTTADSDIQTRLTSGDIVTIGFSSASATTGQVSSVDAASNKPQLTVSYTTPPEAPTSFSHSGNTTSTVTWSWTDNASADTSNVIHDASHAVQCTAGAVSGTGSTGTCQETTLAANTQYTRHVNAIDNEGNTDSSSASAYTSVETPSGVTFSSLSATGFTASAADALSNLTSGSSGVYCQESVTGTNSGWVQTTNWGKAGLTANTQYSVQCKARNGDGDETALTSTATTYTLAAAPAASGSRSASTWYTTPGFDFSQTAWGIGGVQYLRYAFLPQATHTFAGTEATWSNAHANCPGATCGTTGNTLSVIPAAAGQNWYLHLQGFNGDGVASGTQALGPFWYDGSAPAIASAAAASTHDTLTVSWTTDEPATSQLEYGTSLAYGSLTSLDAALVASHSVTLAGLTPGTTYQIRARSRDAAGNEAVSANLVRATTPPAPPTVSGIAIAGVSDVAATVSWTTSTPTTSQVEYGISTDYGSIAVDTEFLTDHRLTLTNLSTDTVYHYRIGGLDAYEQPASSSDQSFATSGAAVGGEIAAPVIDSPVKNEILFDRRPTIRGSTTAEASISVMLDGKAVGTTSASTKGQFDFRVPQALTLGFHTVRARAIFGEVQSDLSAGRVFIIGAPSTSRTLAAAKVSTSARPSVSITGRAKQNGYVRIMLDGKTVKTLRLVKNQSWNHLIVPSKSLKKGRHVIVLQFLNAKKVMTSTSRLTTFTVRQ